MTLTQITGIGRPIDPSYLTNRVIALSSLAVVFGGFVFRLISGESLGLSALWGLGAGFSVFLAWALCRELDPDFDLSAFVAAGSALIGLFVWRLPSLSILFWLLLMVRVVNRTSGLQAKVLDSFVLVGLGGWLVYRGHWEFGLVTVAAFFLDSQLQPRHKRQLLFSGLMMFIVAGFVIIKPEMLKNIGYFWGAAGIALGLSSVFIPVMIRTKSLTSVDDSTGKALVTSRVLFGQALAILSGISAALLSGATGFQVLFPLWAAVVGGSIYRFFFVFLRKKNSAEGRTRTST